MFDYIHSIVSWLFARPGELSGFLLLLAVGPYLVATWKRDIRPSFASELIWVVLGSSALWAFIRLGGHEHGGLWLPLVCVTNPLLVGIVALWRRNYKPLDGKDWICLATGVTAAAILATTDRDPERDLLALTIAVIGDTAATVAVLRNIHENPRHEHAGCWSLAAVAGFVGLGAVNWSWDVWAQAVYPIYIAVSMTVITAPILWHRARVTLRGRKRAALRLSHSG